MLVKQRINKYCGFSLVELLVVISIIGILAAVMTANLMGARERAKDAQKIENLNSIKNALRMYYNDKQSYPGTNDGEAYDLSADIGTSYLTNISEIGYTYTRLNNGDAFLLKVSLEAGVGNDDVDSQRKCGIGVGSTMDKIFAVCAN